MPTPERAFAGALKQADSELISGFHKDKNCAHPFITPTHLQLCS